MYHKLVTNVSKETYPVLIHSNTRCFLSQQPHRFFFPATPTQNRLNHNIFLSLFKGNTVMVIGVIRSFSSLSSGIMGQTDDDCSSSVYTTKTLNFLCVHTLVPHHTVHGESQGLPLNFLTTIIVSVTSWKNWGASQISSAKRDCSWGCPIFTEFVFLWPHVFSIWPCSECAPSLH